MIENDGCSTQRIAEFLRQELSNTEQERLERHLNACSTCQSHLNQSTAENGDWLEASDFLRDEPFDLEPLSDLRERDSSGHATIDTSFDVQQVMGLLAPTDDPDRLGRIGRYEVAGIIGSGGMGIVLKGFDATLNRFVAIKVLAPHLASTAAARKRFQRKAQAAAAVVHENVLAIHGVDTANGLPYLVMPYIRGISLEGRIREHGALPLTDILRIGMQTAAGLAAAHAQGLVHRDIKPSNILLTDGAGRVAITDFGLARTVDDASLTRTGVIAGTPQYMSPEQARGEGVGQHSDLFSLGSVLYEMCTGRPPFRAETSYAVLRRITDTESRPIRELNSEIPAWLAAMVEKLHRKDPAERFVSATEVAALLERCLAHVQQPSAMQLPREVITLAAESERNTKDRTLRRLIPATVSVLLLTVALAVAAVDIFMGDGDEASGERVAPTAGTSVSTVRVSDPRRVPVWDHGLAQKLDQLSLEMNQLESDLELEFAVPEPPPDADEGSGSPTDSTAAPLSSP